MTLALRICSANALHSPQQGAAGAFCRSLRLFTSARSQPKVPSQPTPPPPSSPKPKKSEIKDALKDFNPPPATPTQLQRTTAAGAVDDAAFPTPATGKVSQASNALKSKAKLKTEEVRQNVKGYVFTRYFDYVKNYDRVLEKNFPSAVKVYRVFFEGLKDFYADMRLYLKITRIANGSVNGIRALNRKELELYMQMPRDMWKVAPALIGSSLPMVGYAFFPLIFMYPRTFLTHHFWSLQQRAEYQQLALKERLNCNRAVFRCLQSKLKAVQKHEKHDQLQTILGQIGSGFHPTVAAILEVKDIFAEPPYHILSLSGKHVKCLHRMHGLPGGWFKRHRLREQAFLVHYMDLAIKREGDVHNLLPDAMRRSCSLRGLNPQNLTSEEMVAWLRDWITISTSLQEEHLSLFLHLPVLMAYNHPNNWRLIYGNSKCAPVPPKP